MSGNLSEVDKAEIAAVFGNLTAEDAIILQSNANSIWMLIAGFLVFFMHAGFGMLEAGSVEKRNVVNISFKNISTITIGALLYWALGWGFAYGTSACNGNYNKFIGTSDFFFDAQKGCKANNALWFFQMAFAATSATIVSGAVAGRINLAAYFVVAAVMSGFIYPVVSHWVWSGDGFLSAFNTHGDVLIEGSIGLIDFAGSGVVHATGGGAALVGAWAVGARKGKFVEGKPVDSEISSHTLQTLGTFILWFGWYGFNCGSTLVMDGLNIAKVAVTTTLAPSAACVTAVLYSRIVNKYYDLPMALNSVLAGLVSITAGAIAVYDWSAIIIGAIGALVYILSSKLLLKLKIDDPIGASPVHFFAGIWGVIAAGLFADETAVANGYSGGVLDRGAQVGQQIVGIIIICLWVLSTSALLFLSLTCFSFSKRTKFLRVSEAAEDKGLDESEHGGAMPVHF